MQNYGFRHSRTVCSIEWILSFNHEISCWRWWKLLEIEFNEYLKYLISFTSIELHLLNSTTKVIFFLVVCVSVSVVPGVRRMPPDSFIFHFALISVKRAGYTSYQSYETYFLALVHHASFPPLSPPPAAPPPSRAQSPCTSSTIALNIKPFVCTEVLHTAAFVCSRLFRNSVEVLEKRRRSSRKYCTLWEMSTSEATKLSFFPLAYRRQ